MSHHTAPAPVPDAAHGTHHGHGHHGQTGRLTRTADTTPTRTEAGEAEARRPWTILGLMLMAQFMVILDVSVVNVALPSIGKSLSFSSGDYQWVVSAYVLLSGGLLLFGGRLSDLFDRRTMFLTGLTVFTTASLVSATASSAATMIMSRAAQGTGAAMLTPAALSIIVTTYTGKQRSTALAIWGTIGSMGIAAGVLLGGVLTTTLGWRSIFFVNVPIGIVAAVLDPAHRRPQPQQRAQPRPAVPRRPRRCHAGHRTARHGLRHRERRHPRLDLGPDHRRVHRRHVLLAAFWLIERHVRRAARPPDHLEDPVPGLGLDRHGRRHRRHRRRHLRQLAVPPAGPRRLPDRRRPGVPARWPPPSPSVPPLASHVIGHVGPKHLMVGGLLVVAAGAALLAAHGRRPQLPRPTSCPASSSSASAPAPCSWPSPSSP